MSLAAAALVLLAPALVASGGGASTTVAAPRAPEIDDARGELEGDALSLVAPEDALLELGGGVAHDGGPLSPSRVLVRGLSGARLALGFDELSLSDPSGLSQDAGMLPWAFADALSVESGAGVGLGGALRLSSARDPGPRLRARALVGSLSTARLQGLAATPLEGGRLALGLDAASTTGDFRFSPGGAASGSAAGPTLVRAHNEHQRASAFSSAGTTLGELHLDGTLLAAGHRGGIPGFALAPTRELVGEDGLIAARLAALVPVGAASLGASLQARGTHRATEGPHDARSVVQAGAFELGTALRRVSLGDGATADVQATVGGARALAQGRSFERALSSADLGARGQVGPVRLRVSAEGAAFSDTRPLFSGELRAELGDELRASLGLARASRPPSLEELYAPSGFVLGNPALAPELAHDVEAALAFLPARVMQARAVAFAGRLDDAIVYTNRNAWEIAPENSGAAWRAGVDTFVSVEPTPWLGVESTAGLLWSRLDATGAPLPLAPPWSSRDALRLGARGGLSLEGVLRAHGAASSNAFGTLVAPAVALFDVVARAPLAPGLWLSASVTNLLDVLDARDQNQLPLPGRLVFLALEVVP